MSTYYIRKHSYKFSLFLNCSEGWRLFCRETFRISIEQIKMIQQSSEVIPSLFTGSRLCVPRGFWKGLIWRQTRIWVHPKPVEGWAGRYLTDRWTTILWGSRCLGMPCKLQANYPVWRQTTDRHLLPTDPSCKNRSPGYNAGDSNAAWASPVHCLIYRQLQCRRFPSRLWTLRVRTTGIRFQGRSRHVVACAQKIWLDVDRSSLWVWNLEASPASPSAATPHHGDYESKSRPSPGQASSALPDLIDASTAAITDTPGIWWLCAEWTIWSAFWRCSRRRTKFLSKRP